MHAVHDSFCFVRACLGYHNLERGTHFSHFLGAHNIFNKFLHICDLAIINFGARYFS